MEWEININAKNLRLTEQSELYAGIGENLGSPQAQAGDITINATESVQIIGSGGVGEDTSNFDNATVLDSNDYETTIRNLVGLRPNEEDSPNLLRNPNSESTAVGNSGSIIIETGSLEIMNRASLRNSAYGQGDTGDITIQADSILIREGNILNQILSESGNVGDINFNANNFTVVGSINGMFDGNASYIITDARSVDSSGNINVAVNNEFNINGVSLFQTQVGEEGEGDAGDINIQAAHFPAQEGV